MARNGDTDLLSSVLCQCSNGGDEFAAFDGSVFVCVEEPKGQLKFAVRLGEQGVQDEELREGQEAVAAAVRQSEDQAQAVRGQVRIRGGAAAARFRRRGAE